MSTNTTFGSDNVINPIATNSLAVGNNNNIFEGNSNICLGGYNIINSASVVGDNCCIGYGNGIVLGESSSTDPGFGNQCFGAGNRLLNVNDEQFINRIANNLCGVGNTGADIETCFVSGFDNLLQRSLDSTASGRRNTMRSVTVSHIGGLENNVTGMDRDGQGSLLSLMNVGGYDNKIEFIKDNDIRAGINMTGRSGVAFFDKNKQYAEDTYNFSNQLAGGLPRGSGFSGEGISMVDRTIVNGIYPLGKHQSYLNTGDGTNYAIMMKSDNVVKMGTFVSLSTKCTCNNGCENSYQKILVPARKNCAVIGVITNSSGFIANAGQFPASERIEYDKFGNPVIKINKSTSLTKKPKNKIFTYIKKSLQKDQNEENEENEEKNINNISFDLKDTTLNDPAFLTVIKPDVDRSVQFIPFDERTNYYQVALLGLVVVRSKFTEHDLLCSNKCDVKNGKAIPGKKYSIINIIDRKHLQILLV